MSTGTQATTPIMVVSSAKSARSSQHLRPLLVVCLLLALAPGQIYGKSWKDDLIQQITSTYAPADRSIWDLENVKGGGTVMVLTQDGALASISTDGRYYGTDIKDGKISTDGSPMGKNSRLFKKGERVYLMSVKIIEYNGDDVLRLFILTADSSQRVEGGNTAARRYKGSLDFFFPQGYLPTAAFADVKKAINAVLVPESEFQAEPPATVSLGMTPEQVESVLGKPTKIVDLGTKKIFVYADIKITFVDGKVADVQ